MDPTFIKRFYDITFHHNNNKVLQLVIQNMVLEKYSSLFTGSDQIIIVI